MTRPQQILPPTIVPQAVFHAGQVKTKLGLPAHFSRANMRETTVGRRSLPPGLDGGAKQLDHARQTPAPRCTPRARAWRIQVGAARASFQDRLRTLKCALPASDERGTVTLTVSDAEWLGPDTERSACAVRVRWWGEPGEGHVLRCVQRGVCDSTARWQPR